MGPPSYMRSIVDRNVVMRRMTVLSIERESTRSHSVENSLWKRPWACRKTEYGMMIMLCFVWPIMHLQNDTGWSTPR